jgi:hypothetical protein
MRQRGISAAVQVTGEGVHQSATVAKASLLAPIPVVGPDFRFYLMNLPRLFEWRDCWNSTVALISI